MEGYGARPTQVSAGQSFVSFTGFRESAASAPSAQAPAGVHFALAFEVEVRSSNGRSGGQLLCVPVARASPVMMSQCHAFRYLIRE